MPVEFGVVYHSKRYNKDITIPTCITPDGKSAFTSIFSRAWWLRDVMLDKRKWDDGSEMTLLEMSKVFYDALIEDGHSPLEAFREALNEYILGR